MNLKIFNRIIEIKIFKKEFINKNFLSYLNDKNINKFLSVSRKKQNKQTAIKYLNQFDNKKKFYFAIFDKKKRKLIGTITLRKTSPKSYVLGFMIGNSKYIGTRYSNDAINMYLCFIFDYFKAYTIIAGTNKYNLSSNFCLIKNGFKIFKKNKKHFYFKLNKKNLNFTTKYKIKNND